LATANASLDSNLSPERKGIKTPSPSRPSPWF